MARAHWQARLFLVGLAVASTLGCESGTGPSGRESDQPAPPAGAVAVSHAPLPAPFAHIHQYGGPATRERLVIRDAAMWAAVWPTLVRNFIPTPTAPAIDFATEEVLVVSMGTRSTGGYDITIEAVAETPTERYVVVREVAAGARCIVTQAFTAPVVVVRVPRTTVPVVFLEQRRTLTC